MYPFERFNAATKRVLTLAQEEAERAHVNYIGTEHILLGLLNECNTVAGEVLQALNIERAAAVAIISSATQDAADRQIVVQHIIPTSRVKRVIEISFEEARALGDTYVGTEHLLLALLVEADGIAAHVLRDLGATLDSVRAQVTVVRESGAIVDTDESAEPSLRSALSRTYRGSSARSGLRFVLFERVGTTSADRGPVYVNPADVVAVTQLDENRTAITLRHNDSSNFIVQGSADDIALRLEQA